MVAHREESEFLDEESDDNANVHIDDIKVSHILDKKRIQFGALSEVRGENKLEHLLNVSKERAFKWPETKGFLEKGSAVKISYFDKPQSSFLDKLSRQDGKKFMPGRTKSFLGLAAAVKTDLIEEHTDEHFYEDHAEEERTDLLHTHDDGHHCMADHFEEVGEADTECHFDEENDIEYIVHELMYWGFSYKEMDECFDSPEDLRAAIDFIDKEHDWQVDHECDFEDDGGKEEEIDNMLDQDELLAFKLQVDEIRPVVIPTGATTLPMKPKVTVRKDPKSGRDYFVDNVTKKTSWAIPKVPSHAEIDKMRNDTLKNELGRYGPAARGRFDRSLAIRSLKTRRDQYVKDIQMQKVRHIRLPPDWRTMVDPKTGRVYFSNTKLNTTQWETPIFEPTLPRGWQKVKVNGRIMYRNQQRNQTVSTLDGIYAISLHRQVKKLEQGKRVWKQNYHHSHRASLKRLIQQAKANRLKDEEKRKKRRVVTRKMRQEQSRAIHKILRECVEIEKAERLQRERARKKEREQNRDARDAKRQKDMEQERDMMDVLKEARLDDEEIRKINREQGRTTNMQGRKAATEAQRDNIDEKYQARLEEARQRKEDEMFKREEDRQRREEAAEKAREVRRQQQEEEERRQQERAAERAADEEKARMKQEEEDRERKRMEEERQRQQKRRDFHSKATRLIKQGETGIKINDFNRLYSKAYKEQWDDIIAGQMKILVQNTAPFNTQFTICGSGTLARIMWADSWKQFKGYKENDALKALEACSTLREAHAKLRSSAQSSAQPRRSVASNPRVSSRGGSAASGAASGSGALPMGWTARRDPKTGKTYYLNNITKVTTWKRPVAAVRQNNNLPHGWVAKKAQGKIYFQNNFSKKTQWTDPRPMPQGWTAKVDPRTRKTYYVNHITKTTAWKDPRPPIRI